MAWRDIAMQRNQKNYSSHLYSESALNALQVKEVKALISKDSPLVPGRIDRFEKMPFRCTGIPDGAECDLIAFVRKIR